MKKLAKKAATIMLSSLLAISLTAGLSSAENKLVVQDGAANDVFTVSETGTINAVDMAIGTLGNPTSQITVVDETGSPTRGIGNYQANDGAHAGVIDFRKMRGGYTESPTSANAVLQGDYMGAFHAWGIDTGGVWRRGATINYYVDAPPTNGGVPIALLLSTGSNDDGLANRKMPRLIIGSNGKVTVKDLALPGGGNAYACVDENGVLYRSTSACQ